MEKLAIDWGPGVVFWDNNSPGNRTNHLFNLVFQRARYWSIGKLPQSLADISYQASDGSCALNRGPFDLAGSFWFDFDSYIIST